MSKLLLRDLSPGTTYSIQLRSKNEDTTSDWSPILEFETQVDNRLPEEPTAVTWTSVGRSFLATWNSPTVLEDGSPLNNLAAFEIKITYSGTDVFYTVTGNRFDFTYEMNEAKFGTARSPLSMSVRAVTSTGYKSAEAFPTPNPAYNPVPGAVTVGVIKNSVETIQIPWTGPADLDLVGYNVYASQTNAFTPGPGNKVDTTNSLTYIHSTTSVLPWYFHIRSVDIFGQESTSTQQTGQATAAAIVDVIDPAPPTGVTTAMGFDETRQKAYVDVSWTASVDTDVRNYTIRTSANTAGNWTYTVTNNDLATARVDVEQASNIYVAVQAVDWSGNTSTWANSSTYPHMSLADTTAPLQPAVPTASNNTNTIQVSHNNLDSVGAAIAPDTSYYEVFAKRVNSGWTYDNVEFIGRLPKTTVTSLNFPLPEASPTGSAEVWYVRVRAVDKAGNVSPASASATASTTLVGSVNILEATITGAKITNLEADKLVAGDGIIESLTIGNATNDGDIHSYDYVPDTTGWYIGTNSSGETELQINDGRIKARAVELRNSQNLMPADLSEFNGRPSYYVGKFSTSNATARAGEGGINGQALIISTSAAPWSTKIGTSDNVFVESNKTYIISFQARASAAETVDVSISFDNDSITPAMTLTPSLSLTTSYQKFTLVFTSASDSWVGLSLDGATSDIDVFVDQIMFEEKVGALETASRYEPPSFTTIDGGQVVTGSVQSNAESNGRPNWLISLEGDAEFASAKIYGTLTVGTPDDAIPSKVESGNYVPSNAGWRINSDGTAFFNDVDLRGAGTMQTIQVDKGLTVSSPDDDPASIDVSNGTVFNIGGLLPAPVAPNAYSGSNKSVPLTGSPATGTQYGPLAVGTDFYMAEYSVTNTSTTITQDYEAVGSEVGISGTPGTYTVTRETTGWIGSGAAVAATHFSGTSPTPTTLVWADSANNPTVPTGGTGTASITISSTQDAYYYLLWGGSTTVRVLAAGEVATMTVNYNNLDDAPLSIAIFRSSGPFAAGEVFRVDNFTSTVTDPDPTLTIHKYDSTGAYVSSGTPQTFSGTLSGSPDATVLGFSHDGAGNFWVGLKGITVSTAVKLLKFSDSTLNYTSATTFTETNDIKYGYKANYQVKGTDLYVAYSLNGDIETNLVKNPSFETNASFWSPLSNSGSSLPVLSRNVSSYLQLNGPATAGGAASVVRNACASQSTDTFVNGDRLYVTADLKSQGSKMTHGYVKVEYLSAAGALLGIAYSSGTTPVNSSTFTTISTNVVLSTQYYPTATRYRVMWGFHRNNPIAQTLSASEVLGYIDNARVTNNGPRLRKSPFIFANGATSGWVWSGTASNSDSIRYIGPGAITFEKRALAALTTITQSNTGHQLYSDITGFHVGTADYAGLVSGTANTFSITRTQDLVNYPTPNNYGLVLFEFVDIGASGTLIADLRQASYVAPDGLGFSSSTGYYYAYERTAGRLRELPHLFDGHGTLSVAMAYYDSNATGGTHETTISKIKNLTYFPRNRVEISGVTTPFVPGTVAATDAPNAVRVYIGSAGTTDITKMARVYDGVIPVDGKVIIDTLVNVPRTGTTVRLPGNVTFPAPSNASSFGQPLATNTFDTVNGFTPAKIVSSNEYFSVDGNGTGRISGLHFSPTGLILQTWNGTGGVITTNTGGFILNHDNTGDWPGLRSTINTQRHRIRRSKSSSLTTSNGTAVAVAYNNQTETDVGITVNGTGSLYTIQKTGLYLIHATALWTAEVESGNYTGTINVNGAIKTFHRQYKDTTTSSPSRTHNVMGTLMTTLTAGDTVEFEVTQTAATSLTLNVGSAVYNRMEITEISV